MSPITNAEQFKYMVHWMCEHRDIGRGFPRNMLPQAVVRREIEELVVELNRLGPPVKPIETWRKVWADYRNSTKRKFREHYTKERMHRFNDLEERVIELMELRDQTGSLVQERFEKRRALSNPNANLTRKHTIGDEFDDDHDDNEDEMGAQEGEFVHMNTTAIESFSEQSKDISEDDIKNMSELENTVKAPSTSVTTKIAKGVICTSIQQQTPQIQLVPSATIANYTDSRVQMATLGVLQRIELQLNRLNDTEERNVNIMEENNKLHKLLLYRITVNNHTDGDIEEHK